MYFDGQLDIANQMLELVSSEEQELTNPLQRALCGFLNKIDYRIDMTRSHLLELVGHAEELEAVLIFFYHKHRSFPSLAHSFRQK